MKKYVYDFHEGSMDLADLLGGKGANLAEMTRLGLPVPPGFTITTDACRVFLRTGREPELLREQATNALHRLEQKVGRRLGDREDPLLVSVRSGGRFSMPGMMETVLDVGLNDDSVLGLAEASQDERFAWDSYRRLVQMFGRTVMGVEAERFSEVLESVKDAVGVSSDVELDAAALREVVRHFKDLVWNVTGQPFPTDPTDQLTMAIRAVFGSWNTERARLYRRREHIADDLGTAVTVMAMVYGNIGESSGTGVAFTRSPMTGQIGAYGDYLPNAQGEDVVSGVRNTLTLADLALQDPESYSTLLGVMKTLEEHYRDLCDIEFTVERGKLWMLQTRVGKRTPAAAFRIAAQLVDEGVISEDEALLRVTGDQLARLMFPQFDVAAPRTLLARGVAASPGAAVGAVVLDSATAVARAADGEAVILVRRETNPDDLAGMIAATAVVTSHGGKTSHAAVVARGMGKTCVCGAEALEIDLEGRTIRVGDRVVPEGDVVSVDGSTGEVFLGALPVEPSPVVIYLEQGLDAATTSADEDTRALLLSIDRLLQRADKVRQLGVLANADTPVDAARARRLGAEGVGLARTEHMFLGDRRVLVERVILAGSDSERSDALAALLPLQQQDFEGLLQEMDGLPVTIRLLDPPLHEFLPDLTELAVRVAVARERGLVRQDDLRLLAAVTALHEQNPMLGLRGVRLGLVVPGLYALQVRAIAEATAARIAAGGRPEPEIMIPLAGSAVELRLIAQEARAIVAEVAHVRAVELSIPIGTMIELPRAALTAGHIAQEAEFFSFGTNDLTQTTWGLSRDDAEAEVVPAYIANGVLATSPFESIDVHGVGRLVELAVREGRAARPGLVTGVCGEHGGDPASIHFFAAAGLDYVSCSPYRVPVARLEAARAALDETDLGGSDSR